MDPETQKFNAVRQVLQGRPISGLYLHVPFCARKCGYCDFYSLVDPSVHEVFVDSLIAEMRSRAASTRLGPGTIYVGGGTPTLLAPVQWARLLSELDRLGVRCDHHEFTVEANPETVTDELIDVLAGGGVNRLSIGAQSSDASLLATLDRRHAPESVARAIDVARRAGIHNISLDYIFAIPGQTIAALDADIDAAVAMEPEHLSFYGLTFESGTELARRVSSGRIVSCPTELERRMYERLMRRLDAAGYEHYEISNWAARSAPGHSEAGPDRRCQHNLLYWNNGNWLGLGPGAASHVDGIRWRNRPDLAGYLRQSGDPPTTDHERLSESRRIGEQMMLGLRLRQGVSSDWLASNLSADDARRGEIDELIDLGMLERTATHLRLTEQGLFVADTIIAKLL